MNYIKKIFQYVGIRKTYLGAIMVLMLILLVACGSGDVAVDDNGMVSGNSDIENGGDNESGVDESDALDEQSSEINELKVEDIDWYVEESILDGQKFLSLNYTNKSNYTIMDVEITFKQKEGVTKEQLAAFDEYKELREFTDDEVADIYILGYNRKCASPGETVKDSPLVLNGTYYIADDMAQYEVMEPETISVAFIGSDDKGYVMYYDYKSQVYGSSTHDGTDIQQWSEKELAKMVDMPDCPAIRVDEDDDDSFWFTAYGISKEMYKEYVEGLKNSGYTEEADEDDNSYEAENADGVKVDVSYTVVEESMDVSVEKE